MNIKATKTSTALILVMGLSVPFLASAEDKKAAMPATEGAEVVECVTQADIDVMSDADKAKLTTRVCTEEEAAVKAAAEPVVAPKAAPQ